MANENKNAPGSQNVSRYSGNQPHERPDYEEDRPGYDIDIETEIPSGKDASEREEPDPGKSGMGPGAGNRPEMDDPARSRRTPDIPSPDDERQARKRP